MQHPDIYIFNPTCELAIANDSVSYMPPTLLRQFEKDLAYILLWIAKPNDIVVCDQSPSEKFHNTLIDNKIQILQFQSLKKLQNQAQHFNEIKPWGWSRALHQSIKLIKPLCSSQFQQSANANWQTSNKLSFSRLTTNQLIQVLLPEIENNPLFSIPHRPITVRSMPQVMDALDCLNGQAVFKTIWSSSGRGILMVDQNNNRPLDEIWLKSALKQQGTLIAEPLLTKLADLSFHFHLEASGKVTYLGHTFFKTDQQGKFKGCYLETQPEEIFNIPQNNNLQKVIQLTPHLLQSALQQLSIHQYYSGPIGIDTIWHQAAQGSFALHPAIEINQRHTMGFVNLHLRRHFHPQATGYWEIAQFEAGGFDQFCQSSSAKHPLQQSDNKIITGFIPLIPETGKFGAWLLLK
jgi:hypothetical protein